ncbi:MAG TPA: M23 family metallopeptidase [bacterium]|mgnify:CR=1 FL=1|nr:M23 family metallopeptidase [bacterium]HPN34495.1 M23 family metallopeptidase [bacterium]
MEFNIEKYRPKARKQKTGRSLQVLLVPEGGDQPRTFVLTAQRLLSLKIAAVLLALHILFGFYAYAAISRDRLRLRSLEQANRQLNENSRRIDELSAQFKSMEELDAKIQAALGLNQGGQESPSTAESRSLGTGLSLERQHADGRSQLSGQSSAPEQVRVGEKIIMTQASAQSGLHDYLRDLPTYLPVEGVLTNDYDASAGKGSASRHRGVDIAAPRGSAVRAAGDGVVVFSGWTEFLGHLIILYHGKGYFSFYGHNQSLLVGSNTLVRKAEVIALLGNSGISSAPHLHFEIWKDGVPQDPKKYILALARM